MPEHESKYRPILESLLNSYSQIFFSQNRIFGAILMLVTFLDFFAGFSGLIAVLIASTLGTFAGFNKTNISKGYYGFNNLLVGLGLGIFYQPSVEFYLVLVFSSILTFFITIALEGVIGKYGLPFLSIPFLLGLWLATLAGRQYAELELSERGIFSFNEMYTLGGLSMVRMYEWFNNLDIPGSIVIYFRSLGAIFFQYHLFPGILIAIGLLIYSRIAFSLSLIGFFSAFFFYQLVGADISELSYAYIGFNYILTAIAIGGFFIIPSRWSYLWVLLLTPLISIVLTATSSLFQIVQLSIYSLPFNLVVLLFLYVLKFREKAGMKPEATLYQHYSPEKNLYYHSNYQTRFGDKRQVTLSLPFHGEWKVTQAHNGDITHKNSWRHALDFEIFDENDISYRKRGNSPADYFCYEKPVISPADGTVVRILDGVEDNDIGDVDIRQNWGNSIVIQHYDRLYTQLSHLKKGTFKVKEGDFIKRGDVLGLCGNSGRSPVPHLHFQVQETPQIGSRTINYPISKYILRDADSNFAFNTSQIPEKNNRVRNIERNISLENAFRFIPGQVLRFKVMQDHSIDYAHWEVKTDIYNNSWLECLNSGAKAFFKREEDLFYFTFFEGKRDVFLYQFFLSFYKVVFGYYDGLIIKDYYPLPEIVPPGKLFLHDFIAPFHQLMSGKYNLDYKDIKGQFDSHTIRFESRTTREFAGKSVRERKYKMIVRSRIIEEIEIFENGDLLMKAEWEEVS